MKYLPKSKLGTVIAGAYLLIVALLLLVVGTIWQPGGHADPFLLVVVLVFIITLPSSWIVLKVLEFLKQYSFVNQELFDSLSIPGLFFSALINAVIIYFVVVFLSKMLRKLFGHSSEQTNLE
jgi:hypothetical protein